MKQKLWYESKTMWVALFIVIASVANSMGFVDLPLDPDATWLTAAIGMVQVVLRLITKSEVIIRKQ